ncbi:hypothetical protein J3F83DRAFT_733473 [Trichoderma novae-zelandiae]
MPRRKTSNTSPEPPAKKGPVWATPCRPCAGRMVKNPGHVCRGQGEKSAKCSHCVAGHHKCEDLLVDRDGKIKPAARAVAAASLKMSRGEEVLEYEDLATKYNLLARREAKRRAPSAAGSTSAAAAAVSTEALAELIRRQNEILLDIRAELSAMRERSGAGTPQVVDSEVYEDDYGFDPEADGGAE